MMASCSIGLIGALMVISAANLIVNEGNTLLSDRHVEMLTILRMNREFMEVMRANTTV